MVAYERQVQRIEGLKNLDSEYKKFILENIRNIIDLLERGRFNIFPNYDYSSFTLRWDRAYDVSNREKFQEGLNQFIEITLNRNGITFRTSLGGKSNGNGSHGLFV